MRVFSYIYKKLYIKNVLKAMKLFLIDAYALIYRAYYAFLKNPRINSKGMNTSAIFGFINSLEDVLKREQPTHVAVAFDPHGPTFRHEAFEQYKALHADELEEMCRLPEDMQAPAATESAPDEPDGAQTPENAPAAEEQGAAEQAQESNAEKKDDVAGGEEQ